MFRFILVLSLVLILSSGVFAQARRISDAPVTDAQTPAAMYEDARTFAKRKFEDFEKRKIAFDSQQRDTIRREARQLAARYAAQISKQNLNGDDIYYLGSLHILAENSDGATEAFNRFLLEKTASADKAQTARAFLVVNAARKSEFGIAETIFAEFMKNSPVVLRERILIEGELAKHYFKLKNYKSAAFHADAALLAARPAIKDAFVEPRLLGIFAEVGETLFEIYAATNENSKAVETVKILLEAGITTQSTDVYLAAIDLQIPFLIEINLRDEAETAIKTVQENLPANFRDAKAQRQITAFFKTRERQYRLLGTAASELDEVRWIGKDAKIAESKGKVVLLDFWATWCSPCFAEFPKLIDLHEVYSKQGLKIVGVTRFYGNVSGLKADEKSEFEFVQKIGRDERLPYPLAVANIAGNHLRYGVYALPTAVLIDKRGIIRYVYTGVESKEKVERLIQKLLAE